MTSFHAVYGVSMTCEDFIDGKLKVVGVNLQSLLQCH